MLLFESDDGQQPAKRSRPERGGLAIPAHAGPVFCQRASQLLPLAWFSGGCPSRWLRRRSHRLRSRLRAAASATAKAPCTPSTIKDQESKIPLGPPPPRLETD